MQTNKGFTIVEIIVVVAVVAIIGAVGYIGYQRISTPAAEPVAEVAKPKSDVPEVKTAKDLDAADESLDQTSMEDSELSQLDVAAGEF